MLRNLFWHFYFGRTQTDDKPRASGDDILNITRGSSIVISLMAIIFLGGYLAHILRA
jgi:hypothetical protein